MFTTQRTMKNLLLSACVLFCTAIYSQDVSISDANFLSALIEEGADANGDGAIQVSEAEVITDLNLFQKSIVNMDGIESFINLEALNVSNNLIEEISISELNGLKVFRAFGNPFATIDLSQNVELEFVDFSAGGIQEIDFSSNLNLRHVELNATSLNEVSFHSNPLLERVGFQFNAISEFDFSKNPELIFVDISHTNNPVVNLSGCSKLRNFKCISSGLERLDLSPCHSLDSLDIFFLPNLELLNLSNGSIVSYINFEPDGGHNLSYICIDPDEQEWLDNLLDTQDIIVSTVCNFSEDAAFERISGSVSMDLDGACDDDFGLDNLQFKIDSPNGTTYSSPNIENGEYSLYLFPDDFTITPLFESSELFAVEPSQAMITLDDANTDVVQDFCLQAVEPFLSDVAIYIIPLDAPLAGFEVDYKVVLQNKGNVNADGTININYDTEHTEFIEPQSDWTVDNGRLSMDFSNLTPFEQRSFVITMQLNSPMDTPPLELGDELKMHASVITIENDYFRSDNFFSLCETVVNSFDPNDKTCLQGNVFYQDSLGIVPLTYKIRFENTGTADAVNITIKDYIDPFRYNLSSLEVVDSSHPVYMETRLSTVSFIYASINLPWQDDLNDGYVVFTIEPRQDLIVGDVLSNEAEIFFDFNFPIVTNTAVTEIVEDTDGDGFHNLEDCDDADASVYPGAIEIPNNGIDNDCDGLTAISELEIHDLQITPNPSSDYVEIVSNTEFDFISIYSSTGELVYKLKLDRINSYLMDITDLNNGMYFLRISSNKGSIVKKLFKH
jgi:hypothetical protein